MRDHICVGSVPVNEKCAQLGIDDNYNERARAECRAYRNQLWRLLKQECSIDRETAPDAFSIVTKSCAHDFGTYFEVVVKYDDNDEKSFDLALWLEGNSPLNWDDEARAELDL